MDSLSHLSPPPHFLCIFSVHCVYFLPSYAFCPSMHMRTALGTCTGVRTPFLISLLLAVREGAGGGVGQVEVRDASDPQDCESATAHSSAVKWWRAGKGPLRSSSPPPHLWSPPDRWVLQPLVWKQVSKCGQRTLCVGVQEGAPPRPRPGLEAGCRTILTVPFMPFNFPKQYQMARREIESVVCWALLSPQQPGVQWAASC